MSKTKQKKLTYHDIKKSTNLGIGTISRFFNNGAISEEARIKIEKYIKEHNFQPNFGAKLMRGQENCVYLVVCSIEERSILNITESIINSFKEKGINVFVVVSSYDCNQYLKTLEDVINRKPKTLILFTPIMNNKLKEFINKIDINTYIYGDNTTNKPSIVLDETELLFNLSNEVIGSNKYDNIIYFGKTIKDLTTGKLRLEGFLKAAKSKKIKYKTLLIEHNEFKDISLVFNELLKNITSKTIVICGTHTIFKYLFFEKLKNKYDYDLTDIGYLSEFDHLQNSYQYKMFIDFYKIGVTLSSEIIKSTNKSYVIAGTLIKH